MDIIDHVLREQPIFSQSHSNNSPPRIQRAACTNNIGKFNLTGPIDLIVGMEPEPISSLLRYLISSEIPGLCTNLRKRPVLDADDDAHVLKILVHFRAASL